MDQSLKNLTAMQETQVQPLGQEDPLENGMATHSNILAREISWIEEPLDQLAICLLLSLSTCLLYNMQAKKASIFFKILHISFHCPLLQTNVPASGHIKSNRLI